MFDYKPKRTRNIYDPKSKKPFKISRSKIEDFLACPRCFYIDRRLGISRPPTYPYTLNIAVDNFLKKEFDKHRKKKTPHPKMIEFGLDAIPYDHPELEAWRDGFRRGVSVLHKPTNLIISGGIDDLWVNPVQELIILDYKATDKEHPKDFESDQYEKYKRQLEIYSWIFKQLGFKVSQNGYLVHCSVDTNRDEFNGELIFDTAIITCVLDDSWVEDIILDLYECLSATKIPGLSDKCDFCQYILAIESLT